MSSLVGKLFKNWRPQFNQDNIDNYVRNAAKVPTSGDKRFKAPDGREYVLFMYAGEIPEGYPPILLTCEERFWLAADSAIVEAHGPYLAWCKTPENALRNWAELLESYGVHQVTAEYWRSLVQAI